MEVKKQVETNLKVTANRERKKPNNVGERLFYENIYLQKPCILK
jgi:hypothetical protein